MPVPDHLINEANEAIDLRSRLTAVEHLLGLLPSKYDWEDRVVYLAFQIARDGFDSEGVKDAAQRVEELRPGWLSDRVAPFVKDMVDDYETAQSIASLTRQPPEEDT